MLFLHVNISEGGKTIEFLKVNCVFHFRKRVEKNSHFPVEEICEFFKAVRKCSGWRTSNLLIQIGLNRLIRFSSF